jgi:hypothetical protein
VECAVNHVEPAFGDGPFWQLFDVIEILGPEPFARPEHCIPRQGIEFLGIGLPTHSLIVIAADGEGTERTNAIDHLVGIGPVAHQVAQADDFVPMTLGGFESSIERGQVGVNVA